VTGQLALQPGLGYLSWSRLRKYNDCGERYRLSYVEDIPGLPSGAAIAGKAIHLAIHDAEASEAWQDPDDFSMQYAFVETFTEQVEQAGGPDACRWGGRKDKDGRPNEDYQWWIQYAGPLFMSRYAEIRRRDDEAGMVLYPNGVEVEIAVDIEGRHVVAYIDQILVNSDGEPLVRDWKSGKQLEPLQLAVYSWMLERSELKLGVDLGELVSLRGNTFQQQVKLYDLRQLRDLIPRMMNDLIRGVESELFPLRPSNFCVACDVRQACEYGKTLDS
jgi:hypothetical protein